MALCLQATVAHSQILDKEEKEAIRQDVWNWDMSEFKLKTVPEEYKNKSSVILAMHDKVTVDRKIKVRGAFMAIGVSTEYYYTSINRSLVYINDKVSLDNYSKILFKESSSFSGYYINNTFNVIIGARIIKPDGKMITVNVDDAVVINEGKKKKTNAAYSKLAIPNLEVGDILDYFVAYQMHVSMMELPSFSISHNSASVPVINYSFYCELDPKVGYQYRSINGAPELKQSKNSDGNTVFEVKVDKWKTFDDDRYLNDDRIYPAIRFELYTKKSKEEMPTSAELHMKCANEFKNSLAIAAYLQYNPKKIAKTYEKSHPSASQEKILDHIYDYDVSRYGKGALCAFGVALNKLDVDFLCGAVTSNTSFDKDDVTYLRDLDPIIYVPSLKKVYTSPSHSYSTTLDGNYIDYVFEGETAYFFSNQYLKDHKKDKFKFEEAVEDFSKADNSVVKYVVPSSKSEDNNLRLDFTVSFDAKDSLGMDVARKLTAKGFPANNYRTGYQPTADLELAFNQSLGDLDIPENTIYTNCYSLPTIRVKLNEIVADYKKELQRIYSDYINEAPYDYFRDLHVTKVASNTISNYGNTKEKPYFEMNTKCNVLGLKSILDNRIILNIGKLMGDQNKVTDTTNRQADIYNKYAISYDYNFTVDIPSGYEVYQLDKWNFEVKNACGYVTSEAKVEANKLIIAVKEVYNNHFEPKENYGQLSTLINTVYELSHQGVVFSTESIAKPTIKQTSSKPANKKKARK